MSLPPPPPPQARTLDDLLAIMARLRAPDGCPWDRKQTHESLLPCLLEEAYEFVDAVENTDTANMREELGDLLLQVVFHAQLAGEAGAFTFSDIVAGIAEKLVRRHPHVFGSTVVDTAEEVQKQWDAIKVLEKTGKPEASPEGPLGTLPKHLPALLKAEKIQKRASQSGFDWPNWRGPMEKVREELEELRIEAEKFPSQDQAGDRADHRDPLEDEFGDVLFSAVNLGRSLGLDPEQALARANRKFLSRFANMNSLALAEGKAFKSLSLSEMDRYWNRVKASEGEGNGP